MADAKSVLQKLMDGLEDLSSLEVRTYRGDIKTNIGEKGAIAWDELDANGTLQLVAATKVSADFDTILFRADDAMDHQALVELHDNAVVTSQDARQAFVAMLVDTVSGLVSIPGGRKTARASVPRTAKKTARRKKPRSRG